MTTPAPVIGALVYQRGENVDDLMRSFVAARQRTGLRVGGILQRTDKGDCSSLSAEVIDIGSGTRLSILQDLGAGSLSCRADPDALASAGRMITRAIEAQPCLIVISRFGKLEVDGRGVLAEIGAAALSGIPVLIAVAARYLDAWNNFSQGSDVQLPCSDAALENWWLAARAPVNA